MLEIIREALESSVYKPGEVSREKCSEALTALRGLEWKPIAEMPDDSDEEHYVGGWFDSGLLGIKWRQTSCPGVSQGSPGRLAARGYTHFCRPILPTPPKREVEHA